MFEHLDDPQPPRSGTQQQIRAARKGGRALIHNRRRTRVAAGSVALAATAGVSTVAAVGLPGRGAAGVGAGTSGPASPAPVPAPASTTPVLPSQAPGSPTPSTAPPASTTAPPASTTVAPSTTGATPTAATKSPTPDTAACEDERPRLLTSVEPAGFTPTDAGDAVIAWTRPAGPLTKLVVSVRCAPFTASDVPAADGPVKEVTVLSAHHWVIGDVSKGHLQEVWNADNGTAVVIDATVGQRVDQTNAEHQLSTFGNYLID
jgi:hypothetical protein